MAGFPRVSKDTVPAPTTEACPSRQDPTALTRLYEAIRPDLAEGRLDGKYQS